MYKHHFTKSFLLSSKAKIAMGLLLSLSVAKSYATEAVTFKGAITLQVSTSYPIVEVIDGELIPVVYGDTGEYIVGVQAYPLYLFAGANLLVSKVANDRGDFVYVVESPELCFNESENTLASDVRPKWTYNGRPIQLADDSLVILPCN